MHEGEALRQYIKINKLKITEISDNTGISRDTMYVLFKRSEIENKYVDKLSEAGVKFLSEQRPIFKIISR